MTQAASWQMQEAKARLSDLVKRAAHEGPQAITLHGRPVAVVLSREAYERLSGNGRSLLELMQASPFAGTDAIEFVRDASLTREVDL